MCYIDIRYHNDHVFDEVRRQDRMVCVCLCVHACMHVTSCMMQVYYMLISVLCVNHCIGK